MGHGLAYTLGAGGCLCRAECAASVMVSGKLAMELRPGPDSAPSRDLTRGVCRPGNVVHVPL